MPFSRADAEVEVNRARQRVFAFTLIELLVVIVIVAVLMGLAFPVFQGVQNQAKKTQAKNDLMQIVTAVNAFYTEYGKYPVPSGNSDDGYVIGGTGPSSGTVMTALRGSDLALNPRQIVFISPPDAKDQTNSRSGIKTSDGQFYDPWGMPYGISIDANYDNQVPNSYDPNTGAGADKIRQGVISWSLGKDTKLGKDGNNKFTSSDDVISWQ